MFSRSRRFHVIKITMCPKQIDTSPTTHYMTSDKNSNRWINGRSIVVCSTNDKNKSKCCKFCTHRQQQSNCAISTNTWVTHDTQNFSTSPTTTKGIERIGNSIFMKGTGKLEKKEPFKDWWQEISHSIQNKRKTMYPNSSKCRSNHTKSRMQQDTSNGKEKSTK